MGKLIGFIFGFMLFGPFGGIVGALVGHFFYDAAGGGGMSFSNIDREELEKAFFENLFAMLAKLAKADGVVQQSEIDQINRIMVQDFQFDAAARKRAIDIFRRAKDSALKFEDYAENLAALFRGNRQMLHTFMVILFSVAAADGRITLDEERMLRKAIDIFGMASSTYDYLKSQFIRTESLEKYYAILECSPDDSVETIKKNYRRLAKEYHPDKIQGKGLPKEFQEYAKEKFQEIQNAYSEIAKARGF
jgi:DnaJ like chaperone protein